MHWNIERPVHEAPIPSSSTTRSSRTRAGRAGITAGYAHLGELFNGRRGLALDVPFGLIDFIEVPAGAAD